VQLRRPVGHHRRAPLQSAPHAPATAIAQRVRYRRGG
jgi:hypothetical protein